MILNHHTNHLEGRFSLVLHDPFAYRNLVSDQELIHILWNRSAEEVTIEIDDELLILPSNAVITTTYYHRVGHINGAEHLVSFSFNREYYCIYDHDHEVSCNGIIFFGTQQQRVLNLPETFLQKFEILLTVFQDEFEYRDNIQGDMLVMLLKRFIILLTRVAKQQEGFDAWADHEVDLVRQYRFLVDRNYKQVKSVKGYADMLYKSPKTLSNLFSKAGSATPLQIIHERIVLEAKRQLIYSDKSVQEIAFDLGFEEGATFFKMFKKYEGSSPQSYRNSHKKVTQGKNRQFVGKNDL